MKMFALCSVAAVVSAAKPFTPSQEPNLNGEYLLSPTPHASESTMHNSKFPTHYKDYPGGVEHFDVYSPMISQLYSQVFWTGLAPVSLPQEIIDRYDGQGMAVVGFELDQVQRDASCDRCEAGGVCTPCAKSDHSVPLTVVYNHHFESAMSGKKSEFQHVKFNGHDDPRLLKLLKDRKETGMDGHKLPSQEEHWVLSDLAPGNKLPTSQSFGAGNGGEYRKSFHGYAPGYVQVIESPQKFQITPMQIDTWNRDKMDLKTGLPFVPGPLPRSSLAPPGAAYSGLLECPLTTRLTKNIDAKNQAKPWGQAQGWLNYTATGQKGDVGESENWMSNNCAPQPRTDLLFQKNPTCDARTYVGGQTACHHMWSLLDADQEIPWPDKPLEYHLKFRFWVQPYNESFHTNVGRQTWGIASPVEYDVPKCNASVPGCSPVPNSSNPNGADGKEWIHTITGTYKASGKLVAAHFHCHAPTCLSVAMYRNDTGELLCVEKPVYGGTGQLDEKRFDEPGYILQPPCLWGDEKYGLVMPPDVNGQYLHSIKTSNATAGHHGEMAWQQMFLV